MMSLEIIKLIVLAFTMTYSIYGKIKVEWVISCLALSLLSLGNIFLYVIFNCLILISSLNLPLILIYKLKASDVIANIFETNKKEAIEQIFSLPFKGIILSLIILTTNLWLYNSSLHKELQFNIIYLLFASIFLSASYPIRKRVKTPFSFLCSFRFFFIDFIFTIYSSHRDYLQKKEEINKRLKSHTPYPWPKSNSHPAYQNYVLIIGESVRRDYMELYGSKYKSTPFFSSTSIEYWDNFISPGFDTLDSIPRLLSENKKGIPDYNKNIIGLASSMGFMTHWLSNQGKFGKFENAITQYACLSDNQYFSNLVNSVDSNIYDTVLLPELENALNSSESNFIVLHLLGSHSSFKNRIQRTPQFDAGSRHLNCYVQSILETDELLQKVHKILKKNSNSFSMLYTSDHGLAHSDDGKSLLHGNVKECLQVPLVKISSDTNSTKCIDKYLSGLHFIDLLKSWLNYNEHKIKYQDYDEVMTVKSEKLVSYSTLNSEKK